MKIIGKIGNPPHDVGGFVIDTSRPPLPGIGHRFRDELHWIMAPDIARDKEIEGKSGRRRWFIFTVELSGQLPDWGDIDEAALSAGVSYMKLAQWFMSPDPMDRARAWQIYGEAYGWNNVDDQWEEVSLADVESRYSLPPSKHSQPQPQTIDVYSLDDFTRQYLETALWSTNDESTPAGGEPLDQNYDIDDIAPETLEQMVKDCEAFQRDEAADLALAYQHKGYDEGSAGHDFWLSRNGHGAGFFDRGLGAVGDRLQDAARVYRSFDLYVGDDDQIHH